MASSTSKKVLIIRYDREPIEGFINPQTFLGPAAVELLNLAGSLAEVSYQEIKMVCFVRDFGNPSPDWARKQFASRPKSAGLWLRMKFRDGDVMDGLLHNDLLHLDAQGFMLTPPDLTTGSQRVFVPRAALEELQVLGVVGSSLRPKRRRAAPAGPAEGEQLVMFPQPEPQ